LSPVLFDTNVVSELIRPRADPRVEAFVSAQADPLISAMTIHEIAYGADRAPDPARRAKLLAWVAQIQVQFADRIVSVDAEIAEQAGRLRAVADAQGAPADAVDALIAACALARGAAVATRNVRDFAAFGVNVIDPWSA
jgi:toxin FitB